MDVAPKTIEELMRRLQGLKPSLVRAVDQAINDRVMRVETRLSRVEWVIERIETYLVERVSPALCALDMRFDRLEARMALLEKTMCDGFESLWLRLTKRTGVGVASMVGGHLSENLGAIGQGLGGIVAGCGEDNDRRIRVDASVAARAGQPLAGVASMDPGHRPPASNRWNVWAWDASLFSRSFGFLRLLAQHSFRVAPIRFSVTASEGGRLKIFGSRSHEALGFAKSAPQFCRASMIRATAAFQSVLNWANKQSASARQIAGVSPALQSSLVGRDRREVKERIMPGR